MLKAVASLKSGGNLYAFGLSESDLNRLQFYNESIFFDFSFARQPQLFGLIVYFWQFEKPEDVLVNFDIVNEKCTSFFNESRGVTADTLCVFPFARKTLSDIRATPFWALQTRVQITHPGDIQTFFSGQTEDAIEKHFRDAGWINSQTQQTYKGFKILQKSGT
jgi:hypothetical protein